MDAIAKQSFKEMFGVVRPAAAERREAAFRSGGTLVGPLLEKALKLKAKPISTQAK